MPGFASRRHFGGVGLHRARLDRFEADGGRAGRDTAAGAASLRAVSRRTARGSNVRDYVRGCLESLRQVSQQRALWIGAHLQLSSVQDLLVVPPSGRG